MVDFFFFFCSGDSEDLGGLSEKLTFDILEDEEDFLSLGFDVDDSVEDVF